MTYYMQAIRTRVHGPTETLGARIIATSTSGFRATVSRDSFNTIEAAHQGACDALREKLGWLSPMHGGSFKGDIYWVFRS